MGNLDRLEARLDQLGNQSTVGIAHTRWATHGRPSNENAHPHTDCTGRFAIVLNGIVENYLGLREELQAEGHVFTSETDAEVVAHLLERAYAGSLHEAVAAAYRQMEGHFTFVALSTEQPDVIVGRAQGDPAWSSAWARARHFVASAVPAFLAETRSVIFPDDGEIVVVRRDSVELTDLRRSARATEVVEVDWDEDAAEKGGYETFMLKEIHEQPTALADTLAERVTHDGSVRARGAGADRRRHPRACARSSIVACGTSYHAGLVGKYALERWARLPVEIDVASEFRYRDPVIGPDTLCVAISQSGETADTLAAMRLARQAGAHVLAVTNIVGSQATREADGVLFTRAGLEIGVAATKTFEAQVLAMLLLALYLARGARHTWSRRAGARPDRRNCAVSPPSSTPTWRTVRPPPSSGWPSRTPRTPSSSTWAATSACRCAWRGRSSSRRSRTSPPRRTRPGEMKHGPIALLEEGSPVVVVATDGRTYDKLVSNIQEVKARGARVIAVATEGNVAIRSHGRRGVLRASRRDEMLSPLLAVVPLQLFAYYVAKANGETVDQPRNLAKTVTVE